MKLSAVNCRLKTSAVVLLSCVSMGIRAGDSANAPAEEPLSQPSPTHGSPALRSADEVPKPQAAPLPTLADRYVSPWLGQVLKLAQANVPSEVALAYIESAGSFNLTSEQIVALQAQNVPGDLIIAMLVHDTKILAGWLPEPGPPPGPLLITQVKPSGSSVSARIAAPTPEASPPNSATRPSSIINPSPAPSWLESFFDFSGSATPVDTNAQLLQGVDEATPVRAPRPVPITTPIIVYNGAAKRPNIFVLHGFP